MSKENSGDLLLLLLQAFAAGFGVNHKSRARWLNISTHQRVFVSLLSLVRAAAAAVVEVVVVLEVSKAMITEGG